MAQRRAVGDCLASLFELSAMNQEDTELVGGSIILGIRENGGLFDRQRFRFGKNGGAVNILAQIRLQPAQVIQGHRALGNPADRCGELSRGERIVKLECLQSRHSVGPARF